MNSFSFVTDRPTQTRVRVILLILVAALALAVLLATSLPAQAAPVRPKVPICRVYNGHTYCLPTHGGSGITIVPSAGGSGITPPVFQR